MIRAVGPLQEGNTCSEKLLMVHMETQNFNTMFICRRTSRTRRSWPPWSTSARGTALNPSSSCFRSRMWTGKMPIRCSSFWKRSFRSRPMTPIPSWPTRSASSGAQSAGTTSRGTSRSSWWGRTGFRSNATAGTSSPAKSKLILRSFLVWKNKLSYAVHIWLYFEWVFRNYLCSVVHNVPSWTFI